MVKIIGFGEKKVVFDQGDTSSDEVYHRKTAVFQ